MEDEDGNFEIEVRDGSELRYHKDQPCNYVGVTERVGKRGKKSYQARLSITKHKGDKACEQRKPRKPRRSRTPLCA